LSLHEVPLLYKTVHSLSLLLREKLQQREQQNFVNSTLGLLLASPRPSPDASESCLETFRPHADEMRSIQQKMAHSNRAEEKEQSRESHFCERGRLLAATRPSRSEGRFAAYPEDKGIRSLEDHDVRGDDLESMMLFVPSQTHERKREGGKKTKTRRCEK